MKKPVIKPFDFSHFDFSKLTPQLQYLDNGVPVYSFQGGTQEVIRLEFIFDAGTFFQSHPLVASSCCSLLTGGSERFTSEELSEKLDYYGAYIDKYCEKDQSFVVVYCLSRFLTPVLEIMEEVIKAPIFPQREIDLLMQKRKQIFLVNQQKVNELSRDAFSRKVFGEKHPYSQTLILEHFAALTREMVVDFYTTYYQAANCKIVLSGCFDNQAYILLNRCFGSDDWKRPAIQLPSSIILPVAKSQKEHITAKVDVVQGAIRMGKLVMKPTDPDYMAFAFLNYIFGGYFGSRISKNIREDKGYTYGISSYVLLLRYTSVWVVSSEVKLDAIHKVEDEIYREMDILRTEDITEEELSLVKNAYFGDFLREIDGVIDISEKMRTHFLLNLDPSYTQRQIEFVSQITPDTIRKTAQNYFDKLDLSIVTVGK